MISNIIKWFCSRKQLSLSIGLFVSSILVFCLSEGSFLISAVLIVIIIDIYIGFLFWQIAKQDNSSLPERPQALGIFIFLLVAAVLAFSALYIHSHGILHTISEIKVSEIDEEQNICVEIFKIENSREILTDKYNAIYFSSVTMTTLGSSDFTPATSYAKIIMIFQVLTSLLLLVGGFSLLISRIASFNQNGESSDSQTEEDNKVSYKERTIILSDDTYVIDDKKLGLVSLNTDYEWEKLDEKKEKEVTKQLKDIKNIITTKEIDELKDYLNEVGYKIENLSERKDSD